MCIITLDSTDTGPNPNLPKFINIQNSLELVLQLLPFEELECLEEIIGAYDLPYDTPEKEEGNGLRDLKSLVGIA
jgi:hypothetical protein